MTAIMTAIMTAMMIGVGCRVVPADPDGLGCASVHKLTGHPPDRSLSWTHPDR
jgi:hypothetical protein